MTKEKLLKQTAEETGYNIDIVTDAVNTFIRQLKMSLVCRERVLIRNFGAFEVKHKNPRPYINVHTGERIMTKHRDYVKFTPSVATRVDDLNYLAF